MKKYTSFALVLAALLFSTAVLSQASIISTQSDPVMLTPDDGSEDDFNEGF